jgi:penicillin amidase
MPAALNPPVGFLASANNQPVSEGEGPYLGSDWLDGYRASRISEVLAAKNDWDVPATARLQMDVDSLPWRELRDIILGLEPSGEAAAQALELLRTWDGRMAAGSPGAAVFARFLQAMAHRVAVTKAPRSAAWAMGRGFSDLLPGTTFTGGRSSRIVRRLIEQPEGWLEHGWNQAMVEALSSVVAALRREIGPDPSEWCWGRVRPLTLEHPFGRIKALAPVFNRGPFAWGGDGNTVSLAGGTSPMVIASLRAVIPVEAWDDARYVLPGGQAGNPFSPHYDDQLPLWQQGEGVPVWWSREKIAEATVSTLRLSPL